MRTVKAGEKKGTNGLCRRDGQRQFHQLFWRKTCQSPLFRLRKPALLLLVCWFRAVAGDDPAEEIKLSVASGEASYLKGDYDAARQSYESAWRLAQQTPPADPLRYDVLKRLTAVQAAAGLYPEAESYLQQALTWRENQFGPTDPKAIEDLLEVAALCRRMKDFDRAMVVIDRV